MGDDFLEGEAALLCLLQKMKEEMDRAWKDFFEKNPDKKEGKAWRRIEERLRSIQTSKDQHKGV
jgi:hypothetical protein